MAIDLPRANRDKSDSTMGLDGGWMRLKKLSDEQRKGWYIAGTVYGVCVLLVGHQAGALTGAVEWLIFGLAWVAGVALLRVYIQDKDPTDFRDIVGLRRKK